MTHTMTLDGDNHARAIHRLHLEIEEPQTPNQIPSIFRGKGFAFLTRNVHDTDYQENWARGTDTYWTSAECATDLEVECYLATKNVDHLWMVDDTPFDIPTHDEIVWDECNDYDINQLAA